MLEEQNCQEEDDGTEGYDRAFGTVKGFDGKEVIAAGKAIPMSTLIAKIHFFPYRRRSRCSDVQVHQA